ncbi:MAG: hypothetical protein U0792_06150 [Gemmataceae bacterium]
MIDDATSKVMARFYPAATRRDYMDLLGRWLRKHGRPLALYTDRHSIFEPQDKGQPLADPDAETQFGRALRELDVELIRAYSPQAKGRVERSSTAPRSLGEGAATGEGEDMRRGERGVGEVASQSQSTIREEGFRAEGCSSSFGSESSVGVDLVDPDWRCGEQRLCGAIVEPSLPVASAGASG